MAKVWTCSSNKSFELPSCEATKPNANNNKQPSPKQQNVHGIGVFTASMLIVSEMAGAGIVSLPNAIKDTQWAGILLLIVGCVASAYTGVQLGECWSILQERYAEYREQSRKPFFAIGQRALGNWARYLIQFTVSFTVFGASVVFMQIASTNIAHLLRTYSLDAGLNFCYLILVIAAILTPMSLLGTPKDFWPVSIVAMSTSILAGILIVLGVLIDAFSSDTERVLDAQPASNLSDAAVFPRASYLLPDFESFALGYGTITFAFGGHAGFPTIQHDMSRPRSFWKSVMIAYIIVMLIYVPVAICGYMVYGELTMSNIIQNISTKWISTAADVVICVHLIVSLVIVVNPFFQGFEDLLKIPHEFCWRRVAVRFALVGFEVFIAESIPHFGIILSLLGSTTVSINTYIAPGIFLTALKLQKKSKPSNDAISLRDRLDEKGASEVSDTINWRVHKLASWEWIANVCVILMGIVGATAGTYSALEALSSSGFTVPCYINNNQTGL